MSFPSGFEAMMRQAMLDALASPAGVEAVTDAGADPAEATEVLVSHPTLGEGIIQLQAPIVATPSTATPSTGEPVPADDSDKPPELTATEG